MSLDGKSVLRLGDARVLVTGGAGFIGSGVIWGLNRLGCENIVVADRLRQNDKWRHLVSLRFRDYLEAGDLLLRLQSGALGKFDLVLHLGACSATTERDASYLMRNNFEFTKDLAMWALSQDVRFVYASSAATYGDGSAGMSDKEARLERFHPLNAYGFSKQLFDLYASRHNLLDRIVGLKYFNVFGPNEDHKEDMRSVVSKAFVQVQTTGCIQLFKSHRADCRNGEQQRDFLYVKDAVAMTLHVACRLKAAGLFNIGSGKAHTWIDLAKAVFRVLKRRSKIEYIAMPHEIRAKYQYFTQADISKLRATGYRTPVTPLEDAVQDYIENYLMPEQLLDPAAPDRRPACR
jgi:ADP-L-glycero-D-manno-heptose 6-epimerase